MVESDIEHVPPSLGHNNMVELEEAIAVSILMYWMMFGLIFDVAVAVALALESYL